MKRSIYLLYKGSIILLFLFCYKLNANTIKVYLDDGSSVTDTLPPVLEESFLKLSSGIRIPKKNIREILFHYKPSPYLSKEDYAFTDARELLERGINLNNKFPGYRFVVLEYDLKQSLLRDGSRKTSGSMCYRLNSVNSLSGNRLSLSFDKARENIILLGARVINPDGGIRKLTDDDIFISVSSDDKGISRYAKLNLYFPSVRVGSLIEYVYEKNEHTPFNKTFFFPKHNFYYSYPVEKASFVISIPTGVNFLYGARNWSFGQPDESRKDDYSTYTWRINNLLPQPQEPDQPPVTDASPFVYGSIVKSWDTIFNWYKEMLSKRIETSPQIIERTRLITATASNDEERIALLYSFMQRQIRYISLKESISSSLIGHPAEYTLRVGYGDCIDKAILFCSMLKVIGVESYPIIIMTANERKQIHEVPCIDGNHALILLIYKGKEYFLDPTSVHYNFPYFQEEDYGTKGIDILRGKLIDIPFPEPEKNAILRDISFKLAQPRTAELRVKTRYTGCLAAEMRNLLSPLKQYQIDEYFEKDLSLKYPGSRINNISFKHLYDLNGDLEIECYYLLYNLGSSTNKTYAFNIAELEEGFDPLRYADRKQALYLKYSYLIRNRVEYSLPSDTKIVYLPSELKISSPLINYSGRYTANNASIVFEDEFVQIQNLIPKESFSKYKESLEEILNFTKQQIIIQTP